MAEVISGMTGALQGTLSGVLNNGQNFLDRIFPPEKRNELWAKLSKFATEKPMLASFILSQVALTGVPLGLFAIMTITVVVFALLGALLIGLLGALLFIVVAVGFALVILLPTLFVTTFAAAFIWLWGVAGYYILKWFNQKEIPGIHKPLSDGMSLDALTGEGGPAGETNGAPKEQQENGVPKGQENGAPKQGQNETKDGGSKGKAEKKGAVDGVVGKVPAGDKVGDVGKTADGVVSKVPAGDKVGDVGKTAGVDLKDPTQDADVGKVAGKTENLKNVTNVAGGVL